MTKLLNAQSTLYVIACPSVCLSVTRVDQSKTAEVRIMQLSPQSSPMTLVSWWLTSPQNSKGNIDSGGAKWKRGGKNTQFSDNKWPCLRNCARYDQGYYGGLIGSCMCAFDWYQNHRPWTVIIIKLSRNFVPLCILQECHFKCRESLLVYHGCCMLTLALARFSCFNNKKNI